MFNPVAPPAIVQEGLHVFYDAGDKRSYPGTGTTLFDLSGNGINATLINTTYRPNTYGGCFEYNGTSSTINYTSRFTKAFTIQMILTSGTDAAPSTNWVDDDGAWPMYWNGTVNNIILNAQQTSGPVTIWRNSSGGANVSMQIPQNIGLTHFFGNYVFKSDGNAFHKALFNDEIEVINTTTMVRTDGFTTTIYIGRDPQTATRYPTGRLISYLQYDRLLSDEETYQNYTFFNTRISLRSQ